MSASKFKKQINPESRKCSRFRQTLYRKVMWVWLIMICGSICWGVQSHYDVRRAQLKEVVGFVSLYKKIEVELFSEMKTYARNELMTHYDQLYLGVENHFKQKGISISIDRASWERIFINGVLRYYLKSDNLSFDDLKYLWDQERIILELPVLSEKSVINFLETELLENAPMSSVLVKVQDENYDRPRMEMHLVIRLESEQMDKKESVQWLLDKTAIGIDSINLLRLKIDSQYRSLLIVPDVTLNFFDNLPASQLLPLNYQGLLLDELITRLERDQQNVFIKYAPPAPLTMIIMVILMSGVMLTARIPELTTRPSVVITLRDIACFSLIFAPTGLAVYLLLIIFKPQAFYVDWFEWLIFPLIGVLCVIGMVFTTKVTGFLIKTNSSLIK